MESRKGPGVKSAVKVGALTAALAAHKVLKRGGGTPDRRAEFLHPGRSDLHWNESYYFNFIDPGTRIGGWTRMGILPNQESDIGALMLYAGGSRLLAAGRGGRAEVQGGRFVMEDLEYYCVEPLEKWRLRFSGHMADIEDSRRLYEVSPETLKATVVELELDFEGMSQCFDFKNTHPAALAEMIVGAGTRFSDLRQVANVSGAHYEQAMRVSGTIKIGDETVPFRGSGQRDHSWGVRDWSAPRLWTWLTCQFPSGLAFNLSRVAIASVDVFFGFVFRDGVSCPLRRVELETEFEGDGLTQKTLRFKITDTGGRTIEVRGEALTVAPLKLDARGHRTLINEALTEYCLEGETGYGISEYLHQVGD